MTSTDAIRGEVFMTVTGDGAYGFDEIMGPMLRDLGTLTSVAQTIKAAHQTHGLVLAEVPTEGIEAALTYWMAQDGPTVSLVPHQVGPETGSARAPHTQTT